MAQRKSFLLRIDPALLDDIQRWADDDLRSLNGQIEFLLRRALSDSNRRRALDTPAVPAHPIPPKDSMAAEERGESQSIDSYEIE